MDKLEEEMGEIADEMVEIMKSQLTLKYVQDIIYTLRKLPGNLDGFQTRPPTMAICDTAAKYAEEMSKLGFNPYYVIPICDVRGGIKMAFFNNGKHAIVAFNNNGSTKVIQTVDAKTFFSENPIPEIVQFLQKDSYE